MNSLLTFCARLGNPFTANGPLFVLNNVRLALLGASVGIALSMRS